MKPGSLQPTVLAGSPAQTQSSEKHISSDLHPTDDYVLSYMFFLGGNGVPLTSGHIIIVGDQKRNKVRCKTLPATAGIIGTQAVLGEGVCYPVTELP
jgi:hypothetical protein